MRCRRKVFLINKFRMSLPVQRTPMKRVWKGVHHGLWGVLLGLSLVGCSVTRRVPAGSYLLSKSEVVVEHEAGLPKEEQITPAALEPYVRQRPNKRFLGMNLSLWVYQQANPESKTWWNRTKRRLGQAPIYLDSAQVRASAEGMNIYIEGQGFLNATTQTQIDTARRRAQVRYTARPRTPYRMDTIRYDFRDDFVRSLVLADTSASLLHEGSILNMNVLDQERVRITNYLKDRGYYTFSINHIHYGLDTTIGNHRVNLTMMVDQYRSGFDAQGNAVLDNNGVYRIRDIYLYPNYNPTVAATDPNYLARLDTLDYKGLHVVYDAQLHVRPRVLRQVINLYPNYLYNAQEVKRTYDNIMRTGYYRSASILFKELPDSLADKQFVTFVGRDTTTQSKSYTSQRYLSCDILCTPATRQSYTMELEGTTSADYFGVMAKVGYQNRNLFRGMELFELGVRGGYEFMRLPGKRNSFEIGGTASFSFPRFITPFPVDQDNSLFNPRTKVEASFSIQQRPYYHRTLSSVVWGYQWGDGKKSTFVLRPIDISLVKLQDVDQDFLTSLENPYLRNSYVSQLIAGLSGSYIFNNQLKGVNHSSWAMRFNYETNGNLVGAMAHWWGKPTQSVNSDGVPESYYPILGIRYAQYFRVDANIVHRLVLGKKSSLVYRFYAGWGYAYGNSTSIPFERLFYAGGANSMRGWLARTLGPGDSPKPTTAKFPSQLGNFKLETNLEGRFPVWGLLHGAVFCDVGNIWFITQGANDTAGAFKINNFYNQLGFNTGIGARLDFGFFVFRLDWGIQLHNPNRAVGDRWIHGFNINNTALNFGVGYPF